MPRSTKTNINVVFVFSPEELPAHDVMIEKVSPLSSWLFFFLLVSKHLQMYSFKKYKSL